MSELKYLFGEKYKQIEELYNKISSDHEFELIFYNYSGNNLSYEKYMKVLKYLKHRGKSNPANLIVEDTIDIVYNEPDTSNTYRITIKTVPLINKYLKMLHIKKNHVIFSALTKMIQQGDPDISIMVKTKDKSDLVMIEDYNLRCRLSKEKSITKKEFEKLINLTPDLMVNISFRMKNRVSLFVDDKYTEKEFTKIDLTMTKTTKNINKIETTVPAYELEIECGNTKPKREQLENMLDKEAKIILKILQQSNFIIGKSLSEQVLNSYFSLLKLNREHSISLSVRPTYSLEIQHVTENLQDKYAISDKADGERYALVIFDKRAYLISMNLIVKDTGFILSNHKYDNSILDGELIFLHKKNRHIFMVFDCLYKGNQDIRLVNNLMERLNHADEIIDDCFVLKKQSNYRTPKYNPPKSGINLTSLIEYHEKNIIDHMNDLNKNITIEPTYILIRRKYFMDVSGINSSEVFCYTTMMYDKYTNSPLVKCPYLLDGIIYQPINQEYIVSARETKYFDYKWKPPSQNSIDFYIEFVKDPDTGKILTVFDNSDETPDIDLEDGKAKNKPYKIINLFVGQTYKNEEEPIYFKPELDLHIAYIYLNNGEVRDIEGNIIMDKTVVEFTYNFDPKTDFKFRWCPLRTRYDKTESVMRYRKKYGNYFDTANKIWRSMENPVLMSDFNELAKGGNIYENKIKEMRSKVSKDLFILKNKDYKDNTKYLEKDIINKDKQNIEENKQKDNAYYQVINKIAEPMRNFHNFIKTNLINTYCSPSYRNKNQVTVLDIGCGQGGDLKKFYRSKVALYIGIEPDKETLFSASNGALSRYNKFKKELANFPQCYFIQGDGGVLFNYDAQLRRFGHMNEDSKKLYDKLASIGIDLVSCQFALHYCFENNTKWTNFKQNLNNVLKPNGYFISTLYDGDRIMKLFDKTDKYTKYYTNDKGEKKILYEIIKKYDDKLLATNKTGNAIDLYASWMFGENKYVTEYLVEPEYLIKTLLEDCDLELIDTDFFDNQFELNRDFFMNYAKYDNDKETNIFLQKIAKYYEPNEINDGCYDFTRLERYYIFRKKDNAKIAKNIQTGGFVNELIDNELTVMPDIDITKNSYCNSIFHILKHHKLIPDNITLVEFMNNLNINIQDKDLNEENINKINSNIVIKHIIQKNKKEKEITILDGITCIVLEKDCNGDYDMDAYNMGKNQYIVLLKESDMYKPIYRKNEADKQIGLFTKDNEFIERLLDSN